MNLKPSVSTPNASAMSVSTPTTLLLLGVELALHAPEGGVFVDCSVLSSLHPTYFFLKTGANLNLAVDQAPGPLTSAPSAGL